MAAAKRDAQSSPDEAAKKKSGVGAATLPSFWTTMIMDTARQLLDHGPPVWQDEHEARFYRDEKALISKHVEPIYHGCLITLFLFATFRISGSRWYQTAFLRRQVNVFDNTTAATTTTSNTPQWQSTLDKQVQEHSRRYNQATQLPLDILTSLLCGASATLLLSHPAQLQRDYCRAPLLPGKSLVYQHACSRVMQQLQLYETAVAQRQQQPDDHDANVVAWRTLARNCQIRADYVRQHGNSMDVAVPFPGLPEGAMMNVP